MKKINILNQPNDSTCGPTCLHAVYDYYQDRMELDAIIKEVKTLENGGTLAVMLAIHALKRGYSASLYSYNLAIFDPSWFPYHKSGDLIKKLQTQSAAKNNRKIRNASKAYIEFLELGGVIKFRDLSLSLLKRLFEEEHPVLTGLSATYLYNCKREISLENDAMQYDDIQGEPTGHFVVLNGFDKNKGSVLVADPFQENPINSTNYYSVNTRRLINSIMLGIVTYDSNILIIKPGEK